jgi:hypothetical protein
LEVISKAQHFVIKQFKNRHGKNENGVRREQHTIIFV